MFLFFFCGVGLEFCTQGFPLAQQVLFHMSHCSTSLCSGYFGDGVSQSICSGLS
jgi:hypothetical protein